MAKPFQCLPPEAVDLLKFKVEVAVWLGQQVGREKKNFGPAVALVSNVSGNMWPQSVQIRGRSLSEVGRRLPHRFGCGRSEGVVRMN